VLPKIFILFILVALNFLFSCVENERTETYLTVNVDTVLNEKHFILPSESCTVSLTLFDSDLNRGVMKYRNSCNFYPDRDTPKIKILLKGSMMDKWADSARTISWGRLTPDIHKRSILGRRLALAAFRSEIWNEKKERAQGENENKVVQDLLNSSNVFRELKQILKESGIDIQITAVEKVIVFQAWELPDFDILQKNGVGRNDHLPIDCQVWIGMKK
jgi:hypothetical protein